MRGSQHLKKTVIHNFVQVNINLLVPVVPKMPSIPSTYVIFMFCVIMSFSIMSKWTVNGMTGTLENVLLRAGEELAQIKGR